MTSNVTSGEDASVTVSATILANRVVLATSANLGTAIVGGTWTGSSSLSTSGSNSERTAVTVATTGGPVGGISVTGGTGTAYNAATSTGTRSLSGSFATAGNKSNTVTLTTTGESGVTGTQTPVNVNVGYTAVALDHSNASFDGSGDQDLLNINFGAVALNSLQSQSFSLYNLMATNGFTAALDLDNVGEANDTFNKFSTDLPGTPALGLLSAGADAAYSVTFDTSTVGIFTATYTLTTSDEDLSGATDGDPLTIVVTGEVVAAVPEPATLGLGLTLAAGVLLRRRR